MQFVIPHLLPPFISWILAVGQVIMRSCGFWLNHFPCDSVHETVQSCKNYDFTSKNCSNIYCYEVRLIYIRKFNKVKMALLRICATAASTGFWWICKFFFDKFFQNSEYYPHCINYHIILYPVRIKVTKITLYFILLYLLLFL